MEIIKDDRKHELLRMLKNMYYAAEKENVNDIKALSNLFTNWLKKIFGQPPWKHKTEAFEWDKARNAIIGVPMLLEMYRIKRLKENDYEKRKKEQFVEILKRIKKVEEYLI